MLPNVGWPELIVILLIALLVFGPQRLAGIGGALGRVIKEFQQAMREEEDDKTPPSPPGR